MIDCPYPINASSLGLVQKPEVAAYLASIPNCFAMASMVS